jgi:hypothetical protein
MITTAALVGHAAKSATLRYRQTMPANGFVWNVSGYKARWAISETFTSNILIQSPTRAIAMKTDANQIDGTVQDAVVS